MNRTLPLVLGFSMLAFGIGVNLGSYIDRRSNPPSDLLSLPFARSALQGGKTP